MLRSIGPVAFLALLMVGCGEGGSGGGGGGGAASYSIGGSVTGLTGSGLMLQINAGDLVAVHGAGAFTFPNKLASGTAYAVTVNQQPSAPAQNCVVANGSGTVAAANVTTVAVTCSTVATTYTVRGTVSGLVGTVLTLAICTPHHGLGGGGAYCTTPQQISANGEFTLDFASSAVVLGHSYVEIAAQPTSPPQRCVFSNAIIQNANDTSVTVSCVTIVEFSYVTNAADNTLSSYRVDPTTGALAAIGTPTATGASPHAIVSLSNFPYIFIANEGSNDVSVFAPDATTGALTAAPGSPFPAGTRPQAMAFLDLGTIISGTAGTALVVANAGSDNVSGYSIGPAGALTALPGFPVAVGKNPTSIVVAANAIFVANHGGSNDISAFYPDQTPVPGSPFPVGGNPLSLALGVGLGVGPVPGPYLYTANPDANAPSISGFSVNPDTGVLTPLSGSPFPLPVSHYIATDQTGAYLYITSGTNIVGYGIDPGTGALTALAGFPVSVGAEAYSITIDLLNEFLYVADDSAAHVTGFKLDASTGALTPMAGSPFPTGNEPQFIATF